MEYLGFDIQAVKGLVVAYMKGILAGIAASTAVLAVLYAGGLLFSMGLRHKYQASQPAGDVIFIRWHLHFWPSLFFALLVFAAAFYWEFQRASIRPSSR